MKNDEIVVGTEPNKETLADVIDEILRRQTLSLTDEEVSFLEDIKKNGIKVPKVDTTLTDRGQEILDYMLKDEEKFENGFLTKDIAEGLFVSTNRVSGAILKLVRDGYLTREEDKSPMVVHLTDKARNLENGTNNK